MTSIFYWFRILENLAGKNLGEAGGGGGNFAKYDESRRKTKKYKSRNPKSEFHC